MKRGFSPEAFGFGVFLFTVGGVFLLSNLGVVRFRMGKLKLAEEAFKKAIAIAPKDAFSHCTLGIVYYSQGRDDDAINELTKSIAINSKNWVVTGHPA